MKTNKELELAFNFVQNTDRNVFLTGKAGTGKTTFLHRIKKETSKRMIVVAPTGVAAINAKGATIHSFFQMPFGPILPGTIQNATHTQRKFNRTKIDIIKSLDLVVIDEVSMVRADLLDGIDQVLRRYKNKNKVFGGTQILMIGDVQQLAPVIKPEEWRLLQPFYETVYFFSSKAFQNADAISIELTHIYRQDNLEFIEILNEIRNNNLSPSSTAILNKRYQPEFIPSEEDGYITLTTHNNRADTINSRKLELLNQKKQVFTAEIEGKFNEYAYPTAEKLTLKIGAQVMFIKNDSSPEKRYYNGKIGKIIDLDADSVLVQCANEENPIETNIETWENINYTIDKDSKEITENKIGSYKQIPLRLAWAITIHKSQGLTFEKAIIDAEASFAHGQTYVALSRCTSLAGIVLKTQIRASSIVNDSNIKIFSNQVSENIPNDTILKASEKTFQLNLIADLFNFHSFLHPITRLIDIYYSNRTSFEGNTIEPLLHIKDLAVIPLLKVAAGFNKQLLEMSDATGALENNSQIQERLKKGIAYLTAETKTHIQIPLEELTYTTDNKAIKKDFEKQLKILENTTLTKTSCLAILSTGFDANTYLQTRAKTQLETPRKVKKEAYTTTENATLFEALRALRNELAAEENLAHYQIFTQKSLFEMCETLPTTNNQLRAVNGMGKTRVEKYGTAILETIIHYCDENKILPKQDRPKKVKPKKTNTKQVSFDLFKKGMTIKEIAKQRGFVIGTIQGHLTQYVETGEIGIYEIISKERFENIKTSIQNVKFENISELKEKTNNSYTYNELRLVLGFIK